MGFVSVNEFDKFGYEDCQVVKIERTGTGFVLTLEALIVRARNSQNSNYTDSYSGTTLLNLENAEIVSMIKEGYSKYDANDKLICEIEDEVVSNDVWKEFFIKNERVFLVSFEAKKTDDKLSGVLEFEMPANIGDVPDTYEMTISFTSAKFSWESYMNRVQN